MKAQGADIVVAVAHSGINADYKPGQENVATELTKVPGIDVVLSGHSHQEFPGPVYKDIPGADIKNGTINGKPVVMAGFWGNDLGIVDLKLNYDRKAQKWTIQTGAASLVDSELQESQLGLPAQNLHRWKKHIFGQR